MNKKFVLIAFFISVLTSLIYPALLYLNFISIKVDFNSYVFLSFPFIALCLHVMYTLGPKNGFIFILLSFFMGWAFETSGLTNGVFFGGSYTYTNEMPRVGLVPIQVILYWPVFVYTGFCLTNYLFKNSTISKNSVFLTIYDGLVVTAIDLYMDPIQVKMGNWTWPGGGKYFDIPIGNFVGWFVVTITITGLFRLYLYLLKETYKTDLLSIPFIGYLIMLLLFTFLSVYYELYLLMLFGISFMLLPLLISLLFRIKSVGFIFKS